MRKIIIISFITMMLISISLFNDVKAGDIFTIEDWESYNLGATSGISSGGSWIVYDSGGESLITTGAYSGKCLLLKGFATAPTMYYNISTTYEYIGKISIWIEGITSLPGLFIKYFDNDILVINIYFSSNLIRYEPIDAGWTTFSTAASTEDGWFNITHVVDNTMNYTWWNQGDGSTDYKVGACNKTDDWDTIDRILIYGNSGVDVCIDNIVFDTTSSQEGCSGVTTFQTRSTGDYFSLPANPYGRYLESQYIDFSGLGITGNMTNVSLSIGIDQYNQISSTLSDYSLVVNGNYLGHPDSWGRYDANGYWLNWNNFSIPLLNNYPVFSFGCLHYSALGYYWFDVGGSANNPIKNFKYHNNSILHNNSIYDGTIKNWDLIYKFNVTCYELGEAGNITSPSDFVTTTLYFDFYDSKTGTKLNVWDWRTVLGTPTWFKNMCQIQFYLKAISEGGNVSAIYPSTTGVTYSSTYVTFQNVLIAPYSYNEVIFFGQSSGNIKGFVNNQPVIWNKADDIIIVAPLGSYRVDLVRQDSNYIVDIPITNVTINWWENYTGSDFFIEFTNQNLCDYHVGDDSLLVYQVNNSLFSYYDGYIWEIQDGNNNTLKSGTIYFTGTEKAGYLVTNYVFPAMGEYHAVLYNISSSNLKDKLVYRGLNINVCAKGSSGIEQPSILPEIGQPLGSVVGMIITMFTLLAPFIIVGSLHLNFSPPMFVYASSGGMGIAVSTALGLFPTWLPFFVIAIGIIVTLFVYLYKGSGGGD